MRLDDKGFFSIDALFALILLVTVSSVLLSASESRTEAVEWVSAAHEADMVAEKLAAVIDTVYANGPTFELYLDIPATIVGFDYTVSFDSDNREVLIEVPDADVTSSIARASVAPRNVVFGSIDPAKIVVVKWVADNIEVVNA
ncbi:MAG: hypothetical protein U9M97_03325 [Candidatus Hadarchaeota archaeon]|nr:hypothetical protein [Candidatus Hadarchaeota archaeon]